MDTHDTDNQRPIRLEKRAQIVAAAQQLFLANGYKRTSMEAIRALANVSKPTLYTHYADKEALFAAVVQQMFSHIDGNQALQQGFVGASIHSVAELRMVLIAFVRNAANQIRNPEYIALLRIVISEMPHFPYLVDIFRQNGPARGLAMAQQLFMQLHHKGLIQVDDAEVVARLFVGPMVSYMLTDGLLQSGTPSFPDPARIEAHVDLFLKAVRVS